jgi:hypothetical protein
LKAPKQKNEGVIENSAGIRKIFQYFRQETTLLSAYLKGIRYFSKLDLNYRQKNGEIFFVYAERLRIKVKSGKKSPFHLFP